MAKRLDRIPPDKHLNAKLTLVVSGAAELEGRTMSKTLNAKLPGRGKPAKRANPGA